eukprot:TRINITY_DN1298_c0_g1_i2.p1 TRINITY_DN1298_c0_g1~~TRINITY_DN1298_c0_g1_i2.p1  ORF type:complete len:155 (+),score=12.26 TRINITY_DN1298_c0_g1_i2:195-659(+)
MENLLHVIFGVLGNIFGTALFLAPAITFYYVIRRNSTEEFSGMPYVAGLLNCLLYVWYGLPFVTAHNILVTVSNGIGAALEFIYVILYLIFAPQKYRNKILIFFIIEVLIFGGIAVTSMVALHGKDRSLLVGIAAATLSVCMYASPLSIMVCVF